jgi:hypothetical protein
VTPCRPLPTSTAPWPVGPPSRSGRIYRRPQRQHLDPQHQ